jgi:signal peptidase I
MSLPVGLPSAAPAPTKRGFPGCLIALIVFGAIMMVLVIAFVAFFVSKGGKLRGQQSVWMVSDTMCPTICDRESVTIDPNAYVFQEPRRGSLILFYRPFDKKQDIRRIVGLPGDTVASDENGNVLVNGEIVNFPEVCGSPVRGTTHGKKNSFESVVVPPGQFFVLGDNLEISYDSRSAGYGAVTKDAITGQPQLIYMSPGKGRFGCMLR